MAGKHVVITGASSGIGAALVAEFVRSGARVTMVARREADMRALAKEVGGQTQIFVVDLSRMEGALAWIAPAEAQFGPIDVLVHNAGVQLVEPAEEHDPEALLAMLRLNLLVPMALTRAVLPAMLERGDGTIVDVASVAGLAPTPGMWGYNASKAGLAAASESLRGELRSTGVHVVTVYPGPVDTPMARAGYAAYPESPMLRVLPEGIPSELARLIRSAVDLKRARVIYPWPYSILRYFPAVARWFLDRLTPRPFSRQKQ
ncbi:MAG: SDR family NAD(P)-dependent oxidoreductase [Myxococcales bacterium]|nr:SDR family NAD(P)-dependent oxidoreductase [Myxococcales bacterium]